MILAEFLEGRNKTRFCELAQIPRESFPQIERDVAAGKCIDVRHALEIEFATDYRIDAGDLSELVRRSRLQAIDPRAARPVPGVTALL